MAKKQKHNSALSEKKGVEASKAVSDSSADKLMQLRKITPSASELVEGILSGNKTALRLLRVARTGWFVSHDNELTWSKNDTKLYFGQKPLKSQDEK